MDQIKGQLKQNYLPKWKHFPPVHPGLGSLEKEGAKPVRATRNSRRQDSVQEQGRNLQGVAVCSQTSRKSWGWRVRT